MSPTGDDRPGPEEGPGIRLQREREERGLTEQQVAEQLNLDAAVITALEQNDFPALGAPVFARGHLRRYAMLLGIPEQELLASYDLGRQPADPTLVPRSHLERMPDRRAPRWPWIAGGVTAFVLAAGAVAYLTQYGLALPWGRDESSDLRTSPGSSATTTTLDSTLNAPPGASTATTAPTSVESPTRSDVSVPGLAPGSGAVTAGSAAPPTAVAGKLTLDFRFVQDSWIEIFDGTGKAVLYDLGAAGSTRTLTAVAPLSITIGNAPAVELVVNGKRARLPTPEAGQTVVRFRIDASGTLR